jgi:hypothetical protein
MKLVSINELTHLLGVQRETVRKRVANLVPVDGPKQAKLYDSEKAIRAILGLNENGETVIDYNEAQKRLAIAKTKDCELDMEIKRKERIPIDVCEIIFDEALRIVPAILLANKGKELTEAIIDEILAGMREAWAKIRNG